MTSTFVFEGAGKVVEYSGGYDDWIAQRPALKPAIAPTTLRVQKKPQPSLSRPIVFLKREERELNELPLLIEQGEAEKESLVAQLCDPEFYKKEPKKLPEIESKIAALEEQIATNYRRWEELEEKRKSIAQ